MKRPHLPMVELPHLRCPGCGAHLRPVKSRNIPRAEKYEDCLRRCEKCRIGATNAKNPAKVKFIYADKGQAAPDKQAAPAADQTPAPAPAPEPAPAEVQKPEPPPEQPAKPDQP